VIASSVIKTMMLSEFLDYVRNFMCSFNAVEFYDRLYRLIMQPCSFIKLVDSQNLLWSWIVMRCMNILHENSCCSRTRRLSFPLECVESLDACFVVSLHFGNYSFVCFDLNLIAPADKSQCVDTSLEAGVSKPFWSKREVKLLPALKHQKMIPMDTYAQGRNMILYHLSTILFATLCLCTWGIFDD